MASFSFKKSLTEAIYMVKSQKKDIFEPLLAAFEALNEWNKMNDYCSLLSLGLLQLVKSFSLENSLTEAIYMVKSQKLHFRANFSHFWKKTLVSGWMDGWMDGKAGLRIAYSNQKLPFITLSNGIA